MPIRVACPNCGNVLGAPDAAAGKKGKCPKCGTIIPIPAPPPPAAAEDIPDTFPIPEAFPVPDEPPAAVPAAAPLVAAALPPDAIVYEVEEVREELAEPPPLALPSLLAAATVAVEAPAPAAEPEFVTDSEPGGNNPFGGFGASPPAAVAAAVTPSPLPPPPPPLPAPASKYKPRGKPASADNDYNPFA